MRSYSILLPFFVVSLWVRNLVGNDEGLQQGKTDHWKKHTVNDQSPFEAAGVADFDGGGDLDVFCGDSWYAAPHWTMHKVRDVPRGTNPHYHEDFADAPLDVNGDGRTDIVTCAYFSKKRLA